ncbi:MAG: HAMP domain-containing histidine kinase [Candidatus Liptonbacteria bacterium]|nr:HAMP domain-containing histidine kinase [Candidatus Liptonbacteria bacterium]
MAIVTLFEVVLSKDPLTLVFRSGVFSLVLAFGILLIKSVLKEVEQREELQKLSEQLKKANTELESLSRFKTQILSFASHQIKAPLAVIKQFATILMEGLYGPVSDKVKETLGKMKNSADELIDLINTLLDLRKVEEGKMDYKFETVKLKDLVQKVFDGLKIQADAKKLEFNFTSGTEASVSADPQKLKQVFQNLAENAIKYTPQGFVKLETKEEGGYAIFSVADSGLGIGQNLLPHLFDQEFVRDERVKREIKGTGLGLYIAKSIITGHGGTIWAESPGEGKGSTFYVKLRKV